MDAIDIVCNLFTEREVRLGQTGLDDTFKAQIRMPPEYRGGVSVEDYLAKMDRAGIARSLLIAVRAGDGDAPPNRFPAPRQQALQKLRLDLGWAQLPIEIQAGDVKSALPPFAIGSRQDARQVLQAQ